MENKLQELFDIINHPEENCSGFMALCDKAKALIFDAVVYTFNDDDRSSFIELLLMCDLLSYQLTPVEQIFWVAYCIYSIKTKVYHKLSDAYDDNFPIPINLVLIEEMQPQADVTVDGKKFKPDFMLDFSRKNVDGFYVYPKLKDLKYVVEIDGFDYHSKKEQMNYDYQRETTLKLNGYNVIRFTGSQVYRKPFNCVNDFVTLVLNDINRKVGV